jgi:hypothetical protein
MSFAACRSTGFSYPMRRAVFGLVQNRATSAYASFSRRRLDLRNAFDVGGAGSFIPCSAGQSPPLPRGSWAINGG